MSKIINILILYICIFSLASCSPSKNISSKGSNEKLRILQQDDIRICTEMVATQTVRRVAPCADALRPFRAGSLAVADAKKENVLAADKLSFHRVRNAGISSMPLAPSWRDEQGNGKPIKKGGGYSIAGFVFSILTATCIILSFWIYPFSFCLTGILFCIIGLSFGRYAQEEDVKFQGLANVAMVILILDIVLCLVGSLLALEYGSSISGFFPW